MLGDTGLVVRVRARRPGHRRDELLLGFAQDRTRRHRTASRAHRHSRATSWSRNVLLLDPVLGIRATSIGIREGRVVAVGKAGNPDTMDDIDIVVGSGTAVVSGEGLIATAGRDRHPRPPALTAGLRGELASGMTTVIGQEIGPFWGVGVGSAWILRTGYGAFDDYPLNIGLLGRGSASRRWPARSRRWKPASAGSRCTRTPARTCARSTPRCPWPRTTTSPVAVHTDGLNEGLTVADTLAVLDGRAVHAYHVEGCGGGHTPDVLEPRRRAPRARLVDEPHPAVRPRRASPSIAP